MIPQLFVWFYCLPMHAVICILLSAVLLFRCLVQQSRGQRLWRLGLVGAMVLWIGMMLYITILNRQPTLTQPVFEWVPIHSYREVASGGNPEILRSNLMNVALFLPAGLLLGGLLPCGWTVPTRLLTTLSLAACFSLGIEYVQFARLLGRGEIDDVIHNTLGAMLGCLTVSFGTANAYFKRRDLP